MGMHAALIEGRQCKVRKLQKGAKERQSSKVPYGKRGGNLEIPIDQYSKKSWLSGKKGGSMNRTLAKLGAFLRKKITI